MFITFAPGKSSAVAITGAATKDVTDDITEAITEDVAPSTKAPAQKVQQTLPTMVLAAPKKDPALCRQAKHNLTALDGIRVRMTDTDGSKRFLTEQGRAGQRANARRFSKIKC
ncbi:MAG: hypothetical protein ACI9WS_001845 [Paraglaciecola psychrophila]